MSSKTINSLVTYAYCDAGNYKFRESVVIGGVLTIEALTPHLFDGEFFVPSRLGLRRLVPQCMNEDDHELHAFESIKAVRGGEALCSANEFIQRLAAANHAGWF